MVGQDISHYKIISKLGEGGMGVVYKAEDTRLKRIVALKFLATSALGDEDQKARFLREAQSVALLDHPNIAAVHDIGEVDGQTFMAIAFVDGPELAGKIKERPLKLDEALGIAIQICEGLKEAHEKGVTHRDIKPSNIMLTKKGRVKVTDFGLAHLAGRSKLTKSGTSMGTPAYMSPEQALGEATDRRSDVWGVGVVLYEMIAGKIPFAHEHEQAIIYSIINEPPEPLTALRTGLPTELDRVVGKALAKKPEERYQHVDDLLVDLRRLRKKLQSKTPESAPSGADTTKALFGESKTAQERLAHGAAPSRKAEEAPEHPLAKYRVIENLEEQDDTVSYVAEDTELHRSVAIRVLPQSSAEQIEQAQRRKEKIWRTTTLLAAFLAAVFGYFWLFSAGPVTEAPVTRFTLPTSERPSQAAISPNGRHVAYLTGRQGNRVLWVQDLDQDQPRSIAGPTDVRRTTSWSPDSEFICFQLGNELKKVSVSGGPTVTVCDVGDAVRSTRWTPDGESIVFNMGRELYKVSAGGGKPEPWLASQQEEFVVTGPAFFSPQTGIEKLLYAEGDSEADSQVIALDRISGQREILAAGGQPVYNPSGHVIYRSFDTQGLWAVPFSVDTMKATGNPFSVAENATNPSVASDGTLVYVEGGTVADRWRLVWKDREGNRLGEIGEPHDAGIAYPGLSPNGSRVVVQSMDVQNNFDIWIHEVDRPIKTRLTDFPNFEIFPNWSPESDRIIFSSGEMSGGAPRDLYVTKADGSEEPVFGMERRFWFGDRIWTLTKSEIWYLKRKADGTWGGSSLSADGIQGTVGKVVSRWTIHCVRLKPVRPARDLHPFLSRGNRVA